MAMVGRRPGWAAGLRRHRRPAGNPGHPAAALLADRHARGPADLAGDDADRPWAGLLRLPEPGRPRLKSTGPVQPHEWDDRPGHQLDWSGRRRPRHRLAALVWRQTPAPQRPGRAPGQPAPSLARTDRDRGDLCGGDLQYQPGRLRHAGGRAMGHTNRAYHLRLLDDDLSANPDWALRLRHWGKSRSS